MTDMYVIQLEVPLGTRNGRMVINIEGENVTGHMEILGRTSKFIGKVNADNEINIEGNLYLSVRKISYIGVGHIDRENIKIQLKDGQNIYKLTGYRCDYN